MRDLTRLELVTEAVRAALEKVAGISPHLLDELVDESWGLRYGRPVRLGKNPTKPMTRILATGNDAVRLLESPSTSSASADCHQPWKHPRPISRLPSRGTSTNGRLLA
ncbi:transposase (plasmid) [Streptomyces hygroscopicus subsp. jinggangensis 5008]|nr:transposase [Streptomyces hygroscopicus subsp. jinggangensis 5008]AGF68412.1 transposase [Streptomyces hygroscopicus subsp. jinggangensis TL01]